ncbi:MAG: hypothetical protein ACK5WZ_06920 [Pseudobdellovibrionaceae bacterium]
MISLLAIVSSISGFSEVKMQSTQFLSAQSQFQSLSHSKKQLWVVGYMNSTLEESIQDLEVSFQNGADAIVFEGKDFEKIDGFLTEIRKRYPTRVLGINFLGTEPETESYLQTFALAEKHKLQIAWTDFSGVDLIQEASVPNLQAIESKKPAHVFYVSGIQMKYSTPVDPNKSIQKSALQAMGWVDGVIVTGPKTGVPTDPTTARDARSVMGTYPLGAASGVSAENVHLLLPYIDFALVNSSIADENRRIIGEKVRALRIAMDQVH